MTDPFLRFRDVLPLERLANLDVLVVGAGGIGAPAVLALAKMGLTRIRIVDLDTVDEANTGTQLHGPRQVHRAKVASLTDLVGRQAPWCEIVGTRARLDETSAAAHLPADVVILAVDSLAARKALWAAARGRCRLLVDPRMGAESLSVYAVTPGDEGWYAPTLEGKPYEAPCTARATFPCGLIAGALVAQTIGLWLRDALDKGELHFDLKYLETIGTSRDELRRIAGRRCA